MKNKLYCYNHFPKPVGSAQPRKVRYFLELHHPGTKHAIQTALREVMRALNANQVNLVDAGRLLYALNLAASSPIKATLGRLARCYTISSVRGLSNIYFAGASTEPSEQRDKLSQLT